MENSASKAISWKQVCDLYRTVCLNVRYYGCRAHCLRRWNKAVQIVAGISSSATVITVIKEAGTTGDPLVRIALIALAMIAAVASAVMPFLGLSEKVKDFEKLHFIYSELSAQLEVLMNAIKRKGEVQDEDIAALSVLQQLYGHLASQDEVKPKRDLIDELTTAINKAIPPESLRLVH